MLAELRYRLRAVFRRASMDREMDDELAFHLERSIRKHVAAGVPRGEAERRARVELGGLEQVREATRSVRGVGAVDVIGQDLRYAWRSLRARPGFTVAVVLTLGLGVGANTVMFGIVDRLMFRAPAYLEAADRVHRVYLSYTWNGERITNRHTELRRYRDLAELTTSFDATAAMAYRTGAIGMGEDAREMTIAAVTASLFDMFAARPELGRFIDARDDVAGAEPVAVLGYAYWQSAFGGRADVLGTQLQVGDGAATVIGVAPKGFVGVTEGPAPAVYLTTAAVARSRRADFAETYDWSWLELLFRRKPDVEFAAAAADLDRAYAGSWERERAQRTGQQTASEAQTEAELGPVHIGRGPQAEADAKVVVWVMGVAAIVLLIACANVVNLLLARAVHRRREVALRLALGVSRGRLVQQLLTETLLLAVLGGLTGLAVAQWGGSALRAFFLPVEEAGSVTADGRTLAFVVVVTLTVALLTGLAPALHGLRADVAGALKAGMRDSAYRSSRVRTGLLLFQAALTVVLLVGAGLFVRSLSNVRGVRLGYVVDPVVYVEGNMRGVEQTAAQRNALSDRLLAAAATVPGVRSATLALSVPFWSFESRGAPYVPGVDSVARLGRFNLQVGSADYFDAVGTRIIRGRGFGPQDGAAGEPVIVVSESMAAALWPGADPIGRQLRFGPDTLAMQTVVGIAEDIRGLELRGDPEYWYYLSVEQYRVRFGATHPVFFVRMDGAATEHVEAVRERLQAEMPGAAYVNAVPFASLIAPQQRAWEFGATMFVAFAALALLLAAIGLYSVCAYAVAQRTRELGVRVALGASVGAVVRLVAGQGVLFAIAGIGIGSAAALLASRWVQPLLFSVSARDPVVFAAVAVIILAVTLIATVRPALRATRVDPTIALRGD
jgi:putative ABC transport system permease protein